MAATVSRGFPREPCFPLSGPQMSSPASGVGWLKLLLYHPVLCPAWPCLGLSFTSGLMGRSLSRCREEGETLGPL